MRADNLESMLNFLAERKDALWFLIPKGYDIRIIDYDVYFDAYGEDTGFESGKVILIGYTSEIAIAGLIDDKEAEKFPKIPIKVSTFKIKL